MIIRPYRWYGGKIRLVSTISLLIPEHKAYYEPFMGSGALLLNHPRSQIEVMNDLDNDLVHFMRMLADKDGAEEMIAKLCKTDYKKSIFEEAKKAKEKHFKGMSAVDKAVAIYILISQSFNAIRKNFGKKGYRSTDAYWNSICFNLPNVHERLKDVQIWNRNGIDVIASIADNPEAFVFADPPYRAELRGKGADKAYTCELPHSEQIRLLKTIRNAKCKIMLCGYREQEGKDLYDIYLLPHGWKCYKIGELQKSCQAQKKHKDKGEEFIWVNYELPSYAKYIISMKEYNSLV